MLSCEEGGGVQKTIEHYTFADALDVASIVIEADKDRACGYRASSQSRTPKTS